MSCLSGIRLSLLACGAAVLSALACPIEARAGFTPEQLEGFELSHIRGTVTTVLPDQKVLEIIDPEGYREIITVGVDLTPLAIRPGQGVDVSLLDGLVVDLQRSQDSKLSFSREDIIIPKDMGPLKQGMRVALASGTARVVKLSRKDRSISLLGPLGGIHNLDVLVDTTDDLFPQLKAGDLIDFRLIQPVAVDVSGSPWRMACVGPPILSRCLLEALSLVPPLSRSSSRHLKSPNWLDPSQVDVIRSGA